MPGETIEIRDGEIIIHKDGQYQVLDESNYLSDLLTEGNIQITLAQDEYFVLGDNRPFSFDSRRFGVLSEENIIGRVILRAWPFVDATKFEAPIY